MRKKYFKLFYFVIISLLVSRLIFANLWTYVFPNEKHLPEKLVNDGDDDRVNSFRTTTNQAVPYDPIVSRMLERTKTIREYCAIRNDNDTEKVHSDGFFDRRYIRGLTDERFSVVYCRINKAASTYSITTLSKLVNWPIERFRSFSTQFRNLSYEEKRNVFDSAFTFHFVREPYGRLFSTYSNKFYFPKGNWEPVGTEIVKRYRGNPSEDSLKFGHDITFAELIRFTVEDFEAGNKMDAHIRPMHVNCKPCDYDYDFIGKLETMVSDWQYITQELHARNVIIRALSRAGQKKESKTLSEIKHFFDALIKVKNSNVNIYKLYKRAWRYFQITSVISKHIDMPFVRNDLGKMNNESFMREMKKAATLSRGNLTDLKMQRDEAMLQAYSTVPLELMEKFRKVVLKDCLLYGYDDRPKWLFDRENIKPPSINYFPGLDSAF